MIVDPGQGGYIHPSSVRSHPKGRTTYTLTPLESSGGSTYTVKILAAAKRTYWVEYRQPIGFDSGLSAYPNNGAQFRVAYPFESLCSGCSDNTEFLDMTPATSAFTNGTLTLGNTYIDALYGVAVQVTAATPAALTIDVQALGESPKPDFDFNATTDMVWRNTNTGQTDIWLMNGVAPSSSAVLLVDPN